MAKRRMTDNGQMKNDRQNNGQKTNDKQYNDQKKNDRQHNGQHEPHQKTGVNSCVPEE
jgi:hypothetical protein